MFNIQVKVADFNYELLSQDGEVLKFVTADEARAWAKENIEGKLTAIACWRVVPCSSRLFKN